jgi:hypothetical protein
VDLAAARDAAAPAPPAREPANAEEHEPEHVPAGPPSLGLGFGAPTAAAGRITVPPPVTRPAAGRTAAPAAPARPAPSRRPDSMPLLLWVLLGAGFALFGGLLVSMLSGGGDEPSREEPVVDDGGGTAPGRGEPDVTPPAGPRSTGALGPGTAAREVAPGGLFAAPQYGQGARDAEPPRVLDGDVPEQLTKLTEGTWVLAFLDPLTPAGSRSILKVHQAHRALLEQGIEVALVVPRVVFQTDGGWVLDERALRTRLRELGIWDGLTVVLDPPAEAGEERGRVHTAYGRKGRRVCGAVVHRGGQELRVAPRDRDGSLELDLLATMAEKARSVRGD